MTVTTNSVGGFAVTVQPTADHLTGQTPGNLDVIPISALSVKENGADDYVVLSADTAATVHRQTRPSVPDGDAVSNDY